MPKLNIPDRPRYATCRVCHGSIANRGKGWYHHASERATGAQPPGHYAEPARAVA
jgi:hypothetical protein